MYTFILECHHNGIITQLDRMESESHYFSFESGVILAHARAMALIHGANNFSLHIVRINRVYADIDRIWG